MSTEVITTALDMIYPKSPEVDHDVESEITDFLEKISESAPEEDAFIIRSELRKSVVAFKNRVVLYQQREAIQHFFDDENENITRFLSGSLGVVEFLKHELGLSTAEITELSEAFRCAEKFKTKIKSVPIPNAC
ncbi:MAG: hypothetical protein KAR35_10405 [Candidatus Heimdallarchaeota archaeon]|nr:hypothetical protein [Candidatus Heimdallarchaeota archaeon]MCK5049768.1 hypothetical protein [Candidatus Heimdallarchaeota archaeon]